MQHSVHVIDSLSHRLELLGLDKALQVSTILGIAEGIRGSALYITEHDRDPDNITIALKVQIDKKSERLSINSLNMEHPGILRDRPNVTHIVTGKYFYNVRAIKYLFRIGVTKSFYISPPKIYKNKLAIKAPRVKLLVNYIESRPP